MIVESNDFKPLVTPDDGSGCDDRSVLFIDFSVTVDNSYIR